MHSYTHSIENVAAVELGLYNCTHRRLRRSAAMYTRLLAVGTVGALSVIAWMLLQEATARYKSSTSNVHCVVNGNSSSLLLAYYIRKG